MVALTIIQGIELQRPICAPGIKVVDLYASMDRCQMAAVSAHLLRTGKHRALQQLSLISDHTSLPENRDEFLPLISRNRAAQRHTVAAQGTEVS